MKNKLFKYVPYIILLMLLCITVFYIYKNNIIFIYSDAASGLVLANHLNKIGSILSTEWFYATELKFINNNLIFTPLFSLTDNWSIIRALGNGVCLLLMVVSALYLYKQLEIKNKAILACLLLLPFSIQYFGMYIAQPSYIFSSVKTFLTIGLLLSYLKKDNNKKIKVFLISLLVLIQGSEGMRNLVLTIIPIMLMYVVYEYLNYKNVLDDEDKRYLRKLRMIVPIICIFTLVGFMIFRFYFSNNYSFMSFDHMNFITINADTIAEAVNSWLKAFGYVEGRVISTTLFHNCLSLILFVTTIVVIIRNIKNRKQNNKYYFVFTMIIFFAILILLGLTLFVHFINSDMERYNLPIVLSVIPLIFIELEKEAVKDKLMKGLFVVFILLSVICGIDNLLIYKDNNNRLALQRINTGRTNGDTVELKEIVNMLIDNEYYNGYSYFWNGNVSTELSNGKIEMWVWGNGGANTTELLDLNQIFEWAQLKSHVTERPSGKVFLIFSQMELDYSKITEKLDWVNVIYNSENYTVYGYNNYNELANDFNS